MSGNFLSVLSSIECDENEAEDGVKVDSRVGLDDDVKMDREVKKKMIDDKNEFNQVMIDFGPDHTNHKKIQTKTTAEECHLQAYRCKLKELKENPWYCQRERIVVFDPPAIPSTVSYLEAEFALFSTYLVQLRIWEETFLSQMKNKQFQSSLRALLPSQHAPGINVGYGMAVMLRDMIMYSMKSD